jgi:hypothetical protein
MVLTGRPVVLTPSRTRLAYVIAVAADVVQFLLGPIGWAGGDAIVDVAAMIATSWLLGFHPLLLPTFVLELVPIADLLPSWTACVALVIALRRKQHAPPPPGSGEVIDV